MTTATLITTESEEVIKMAKKVATFCRDKPINKVNKNQYIFIVTKEAMCSSLKVMTLLY